MVAEKCGHAAIEATGVSQLCPHSILPAEKGGHLGVPSLHQLFLCLLDSVSDHQRTEVLYVHWTTRPGEERGKETREEEEEEEKREKNEKEENREREE